MGAYNHNYTSTYNLLRDLGELGGLTSTVIGYRGSKYPLNLQGDVMPAALSHSSRLGSVDGSGVRSSEFTARWRSCSAVQTDRVCACQRMNC